MTDLRKAAQDSIDLICQSKLCEINSMSSRAESIRLLDKAIEALREALQAEPEKPVAWIYEGEPSFDGKDWHTNFRVTLSENVAIFECGSIKKPTPLYTAHPSIDALIAEAIEKHDEEMADIRTVNTRKLAQPYLDKLIAEIDGLRKHGDYNSVYGFDLEPILDKYRTKPRLLF